MTARQLRSTAASIAIALTAFTGSARGDDIVAEANDQPARGEMFELSYAAEFDRAAFGDANGVVVQRADPEESRGGRDAVARRLESMRQRSEARIATVDRIVGLSEKQKTKLQFAMESDLRRLADTVAEVRDKYIGRSFTITGRGLDAESQKVMREAAQDGGRCRELIQQASGAESLLSKAIPGTLDDAQAERYASVMDARRGCRWKAMVAIGLARVDEVAGLTQQQHDLLTEALLASPPPDDEQLSAGPAVQSPPADVVVAARVTEMVTSDSKLAAVLDPRQTKAIKDAATRTGVAARGGVRGLGVRVELLE